jgi:hypothetical protein
MKIDMVRLLQAKRLLAAKKAAAQKKQTSGASAAAAREAKERAKKAKGKKDKSHFNQVRAWFQRPNMMSVRSLFNGVLVSYMCAIVWMPNNDSRIGLGT